MIDRDWLKTTEEMREFLDVHIQTRRMMMEQSAIYNEHPYCCIEDFLLQHGRPFMPDKLPAGIKRGAMKECFRNATQLMIEHDDLAYVEGYACGLIPVMHAWCVDRFGRVVDPTWEDGRVYYGVVLRDNYVLRCNFQRERYGVLDYWEGEWPLLTGKDDPHDALFSEWIDRENDVLQWTSVI
jgi:hypothetical protein